MWFCQVFVVDGMLIIRPVLSVEEKIKKYIVELSGCPCPLAWLV